MCILWVPNRRFGVRRGDGLSCSVGCASNPVVAHRGHLMLRVMKAAAHRHHSFFQPSRFALGLRRDTHGLHKKSNSPKGPNEKDRRRPFSGNAACGLRAVEVVFRREECSVSVCRLTLVGLKQERVSKFVPMWHRKQNSNLSKRSHIRSWRKRRLGASLRKAIARFNNLPGLFVNPEQFYHLSFFASVSITEDRWVVWRWAIRQRKIFSCSRRIPASRTSR